MYILFIYRYIKYIDNRYLDIYIYVNIYIYIYNNIYII